MTIVEMLGQSGVLSLLGMGVVFGFLVILIIMVTVAGKIIHALGVDKAAVAGAAGNNAEVTAAITAAVSEYRKKG
jgi:oxaloacetate decarboxylase gamma subunit